MNYLSFVLACSGPEALGDIFRSITIGYYCAAIGSVVTLALAYDVLRRRRSRFTLLVAAFMLMVHPAWTINTIHGDCGASKRAASYFFTAVYSGLIVYQFVVSKRAVEQVRSS